MKSNKTINIFTRRSLLTQISNGGSISSFENRSRVSPMRTGNLCLRKKKENSADFEKERVWIGGMDREEKPCRPGVILTVDHPRCRGEQIVLPVFLGY